MNTRIIRMNECGVYIDRMEDSGYGHGIRYDTTTAECIPSVILHGLLEV